MGLLEVFEAGPPIKQRLCAICELRMELKRKRKDADLKGLDALISAILAGRKAGTNPKHGWNSHNVVAVLNAEGYKVTRRQLDAHLHHLTEDADGAR